NARRERIDETTPTEAINHYGASKLAMEAVVSASREQLPCVVTRPFNYTGPGQAGHFLVPKIVAHFAKRADRIELGNIDVERDFLDVRSVSILYARLLGCDAAVGATVNLCSGRSVTIRDLMARLQRLTGHHMQVAVNPELVRAREIPRLVGCNARLRSLIGDWPDIYLDQTLRDMLDAAD
ncbi:MAG: GDP-mannose 4,6-dehydratase, partial [Gammaproteobacteria bacterium]|nr:GDP-mannose 4,6-dehydratase [Gammaproteobacteria bacterium]